MTTEPCTVDEGLSLADAQDRMSANNIRHLLVSRDGRLVGVLSSRDVSFASSLPGVEAEKIQVGEAMSKAVYSCSKDAPLHEVAWQMEGHRWGCAVVLDGDTVVGIFTTTDALRALRQVVTGEMAEPAVTPTHRPEIGQERDLVKHHTRVSSSLAAHGVGPSPNQGMIRP